MGARPGPTKQDCAPTAELFRCSKFRIKGVEGSYYPCSENKGADQLRGYREADLRLYFRIYAKSQISHDVAHMMSNIAY